MTRYQIVAKKSAAVAARVGDPYEFLGLAEIEAEKLRGALKFVENAGDVVVTVEAVSNGGQ